MGWQRSPHEEQRETQNPPAGKKQSQVPMYAEEPPAGENHLAEKALEDMVDTEGKPAMHPCGKESWKHLRGIRRSATSWSLEAILSLHPAEVMQYLRCCVQLWAALHVRDTMESLAKGCKDNEGTGAPALWGKTQSCACPGWRTGASAGNLINEYECLKRVCTEDEPGSFLWCPETEAIGTNWNTGFIFWT